MEKTIGNKFYPFSAKMKVKFGTYVPGIRGKKIKICK